MKKDAAPRPRMPAVVKKEMKSHDAGEDEDSKRLEYKGFDKTKLNKSRKAQRKADRQAKKQGKQQHQQARSQESEKMKRLELENEKLRKQLAQQSAGKGKAEQPGAKKRKSGLSAPEPEPAAKKSKKEPGHRAEQQGKDGKDKNAKEIRTQGKDNGTKDSGKEAKGKGAKDQGMVKVSGKNANFMKMIVDEGLDRSSELGDQNALKRALEEDEKEIAELEKKLGGSYRNEFKEEGLLDFFDSLDHLDEESDIDDEELGSNMRIDLKDLKKLVKGQDKSKKGSGKGVRFEQEDDEEEEEEEDEEEDEEQEEDSDDPQGGEGDDSDAEGADEGGDSDEDEDHEGDEDDDDGSQEEEEVESNKDEDEDEDDEDDEDEVEDNEHLDSEEQEEEEEGEEEEKEEMWSKNGIGKAGGKVNEKEPQTDASTLQKYVPPHLRAQIQGSSKLQSAIRSNLNKLSEANISSISKELNSIYSSNPRNDVDQCLGDTVLELAGEGSGKIIGQFAALYAAVIAALHSSVGPSVGARFLERIVRTIDSSIGVEDQVHTGKNLSKILAHLYIFKAIHSSVVFELVTVCTKRFTEHTIEMLLECLRIAGYYLRSDDPSALKNIIQVVRTKASGDGTSVTLPPRARFLLDFIYDLQNNRQKRGIGASGVAEAEVQRLSKWLKTWFSQHGTPSQLRPQWEDIVHKRLRGPWWEQGARLEKVLMTGFSGKSEGTNAVKKGVDKQQNELLKLAKTQQMGSDVRKAVFLVIMQSEDYMDAVEKLIRLGLKDKQGREMIKVLFHCCSQEKGYNPFYSLVLENLCEQEKNHQFTLRLCFWDAFKDMDSWVSTPAGRNKIGNISRMLAHAWSNNVLSLSLLKPIEIEQMGEGGHLSLQLALRALLTHASVQTLTTLVSKIDGKDKEMRELRSGILWFLHKHMGAKKDAKPMTQIDGEASQTSDKKQLLKDRVQVMVQLMTRAQTLANLG